MTLNDKEFNVITSRNMFKSDYKLALTWLKSKGFDISQADYYRTLSILDDQAQKRLYEIASKFEIIAVDEIEKFKSLEKMLYEEYHKEKTPLNRARILQMIIQMQPYITSLYDQTKQMLEGKIAKQKDIILSQLGV